MMGESPGHAFRGWGGRGGGGVLSSQSESLSREEPGRRGVIPIEGRSDRTC